MLADLNKYERFNDSGKQGISEAKSFQNCIKKSLGRRRKEKTMKDKTEKFCVGDIVEATDIIYRRDRRSILQRGDKVRVRTVWQTNSDSPQIIGLDIEGKLPICDIVCSESVPLRLVYSPHKKTC